MQQEVHKISPVNSWSASKQIVQPFLKQKTKGIKVLELGAVLGVECFTPTSGSDK
jgi:hypothetical protein